mgnify:CR=1 FL=1
MNWISKILKAGENIKRSIDKKFPTKEERANSKWTSCCRGPLSLDSLKENFYQCPDCLKTFPISPKMRFESLFLKNDYEILNTPLIAEEDPLQWHDASGKYIDKLKAVKKKTKLNSSIQVAIGKINKDLSVVAVCSEFKFFGGSISQNEGEAILAACSKSIETNSPLIIFAQGGGMKMQSSMLSLAQMPRTVYGISEVKKNNIPVLVVVDTVVSGGISASYAAVGDFLIFEGEKSKFMFAGPRVIAGTSGSGGSLPSNFQDATFCIEHGFGDFFIKYRKDTRDTLNKLLNILMKINTSVSSVSSNETSEDSRSLTKFAS